MDKLLHHLRRPGMLIALYIPTNTGFPWFQSRAGFCPPTVSPSDMHQDPFRKARANLCTKPSLREGNSGCPVEWARSQMCSEIGCIHRHTHDWSPVIRTHVIGGSLTRTDSSHRFAAMGVRTSQQLPHQNGVHRSPPLRSGFVFKGRKSIVNSH